MKLHWTQTFQAELDAAVDFLALKSPRAAHRLVDRLRRSLATLARHPLSGRAEHRVADENIRVALSGEFRVWYRVDQREGRIDLLYFRHGARLSPWEFPPVDEEE